MTKLSAAWGPMLWALMVMEPSPANSVRKHAPPGRPPNWPLPVLTICEVACPAEPPVPWGKTQASMTQFTAGKLHCSGGGTELFWP